MIKKCFILLVLGIILSISVSPIVLASKDKAVKRAEGLVEVGNLDQAVLILKQRIKEEAGDFEANWLLGKIYLEKGWVDNAEKQFNYSLTLKPEKKQEVIELYKGAVNDSLARNEIRLAADFADKVITLDEKFKQEAFQLFYEKGKKNSGNLAERCFDRALEFSSSDYEKRLIGKEYLKMRVALGKGKKLENKSVELLGQDFVDKVLPQPKEVVIHEKVFTDDDAGESGTIYVFDHSKVEVFPGDKIVVSGIVPEGANNILIYNDGKWEKISGNGPYTILFKDTPKSGHQEVWIDKGKGVKVFIKLVRTIISKPDYSLLE